MAGIRELEWIWERLGAGDRGRLLAFARSLRQAQAVPDAGLPPPGGGERPSGETVVEAIRRLRACYPMLNRRRLLGEISVLLARYQLGERPAPRVIDDLERIFQRHYRELLQEMPS